jgi:hypothetical protein
MRYTTPELQAVLAAAKSIAGQQKEGTVCIDSQTQGKRSSAGAYEVDE